MSQILVKSKSAVTLLGAGSVSRSLFELAITRAPALVAADGGADFTRHTQHEPLAIIGDIDSLTNDKYWQNSDIPIHEIKDQDTTDFDKCICAIDAPLILGVGFSGGRVDHELAVFSDLLKFAQRRIIIISDRDVCFLCPQTLELDLPEATRVSLHPLRPVVGVHSKGLRWSVLGLELSPGGRLGNSNESQGPVFVGFDRPGVLVILPLEALDAAIDALSTKEH